jgi:hypothetical protein
VLEILTFTLIDSPEENMKKAILILANIFAALAANAADLNAPMTKPITLRSEIERGIRAVSGLSPADALNFDRSVEGIINANQQANTDTKGFLYGVNYAAWHALWLALSSDAYPDKLEMDVAVAHAEIYFKVSNKLRAELDLTDHNIRVAAGTVYIANEEARFADLLKSRKFKKTYLVMDDRSVASEKNR